MGSRGDVQPFVALGRELKNKHGHRVRLATHGTFKKFVEENGLEFFDIGGDPAELMAFMVKNPGLIPGMKSLKDGDVGKRQKGMAEILQGCWKSCADVDEVHENDDITVGSCIPFDRTTTRVPGKHCDIEIDLTKLLFQCHGLVAKHTQQTYRQLEKRIRQKINDIDSNIGQKMTC